MYFILFILYYFSDIFKIHSNTFGTKKMSSTEPTLSLSNEDGIEEVELTPGEALDQLSQAWKNELVAPELLPHRAEFVESVLEQVREVEERLKDADKDEFGTILKKMEVDRIRYILTSYLRCRLQKIEKFVFHVLSSDETRKRDGLDVSMSPEETRFATDYAAHLEEYLQAVALQKMPSNAQQLDRDKIAYTPNLNHYVFIRMHQKMTDVSIPNISDDTRQIEVDLDLGTQHITPYKIAAPLVQSGAACLM